MMDSDVKCEMVRDGLRCCLVLCCVCLMFCVHAGSSGTAGRRSRGEVESKREDEAAAA